MKSYSSIIDELEDINCKLRILMTKEALVVCRIWLLSNLMKCQTWRFFDTMSLGMGFGKAACSYK